MFRLPRISWTERIVIAVATALAGAITMFAILRAFATNDPSPMTLYAGAATGAGLSGMLFASLFGRSGSNYGVLLAVLAAILATGLGSFLGGITWAVLGFLGLGPEPVHPPSLLETVEVLLQAGGFAFLVVMYLSPAEFPHLLLIWAILMVGVHGTGLLIRHRTGA